MRRRVLEHKAGKTITTKRLAPGIIIFYESFLAKQDSVRRERYLKTSKGKSTLRMMLRESLKTSPGGETGIHERLKIS